MLAITPDKAEFVGVIYLYICNFGKTTVAIMKKRCIQEIILNAS